MIHNMFQNKGSVAVLALVVTVSAAQAESHLMRYADVHRDKIVFTYEGDLWLVPTGGGDARRITNDPGSELWAKFSPDGRQIAFTAQYDGGVDVYVMDARGGVPVRLTYHPAGDLVLGWFSDGKGVLFRSRRKYPTRGEEIYRVSVDGGMPQQLPVDRAGLTALSPDGKRIAYNRISREQRTWKRHQGGTAQDIWMGSLQRGDFQRITDWPGTDNFPMWHDDAIYFNSDRENGTLNIYKLDLGSMKVSPLTRYTDYDVKYPSIGPANIVFQYGESLHLLSLETYRTTKVSVDIPSDLVRMRPEFVEVEPTKGSFALSPTGKRLLLEARGEILNLPVEDGEPHNLTRAPGTREKNAAWSPNGRWVAFVSDRDGEEEVYLIDQKGQQPWKQLTTGGLGFRMHLVWSPDSKYILFSDKFMRLNLVDAESGGLSVIDRADYDDAWERWGIQEYVWSSDSRWVAYTKMERSMYEAIFLYSIGDTTITRVTGEMTEDFSPSFDPEGQYLYFLSHRTFEPIMGFIDQNHVFLDVCRPYAVILKDGEVSPFFPKDSEEDIDNGNGDSVKETEEDEEDKETTIPETDIDLDGIENRIVVVEGVPAGNYFRLEATEDGFVYLKKPKHEFLKYDVVTDQSGGELELYGYDIEDDETTKLISGIANYHLSADGEKLVYRAGSTYGVIDVAEEAEVGDGKVDLEGTRIRVNRSQEFLQIYNEAWRLQRDWFYDPGMHGYDWEEVGKRYRRFVPYCGNRSDLNYLIGEMIAELNIGHTYVGGGDIQRDAKRVSVGMLGADLTAEAGRTYYRISHIIPGISWSDRERSPLAGPGCPIKVGDYLIAIDGEEVTTADNVYAFLQNKAKKMVTLTYNDSATAEGAHKCRVQTIGSENRIRYREWVEGNRAMVERSAGGRIGYVHLPNMMTAGLIEFAKVFYAQHYKNGFIIDERYNGGGFVGDMIIDRLERKIWSLTQPREGGFLRDPERTFHGHLVILINEDSGSNAEYFAEAIKLKKIAPIIGMRTWGGAVGVEAHQDLVDGGMTTPPQFAPYGLDRQWLIEGHGVDPDIEVQNMPGDVLRGKDSQLEAAIKNIQQRLADDPMDLPRRPAYPDKSKKDLRAAG